MSCSLLLIGGLGRSVLDFCKALLSVWIYDVYFCFGFVFLSSGLF